MLPSFAAGRHRTGGELACLSAKAAWSFERRPFFSVCVSAVAYSFASVDGVARFSNWSNWRAPVCHLRAWRLEIGMRNNGELGAVSRRAQEGSTRRAWRGPGKSGLRLAEDSSKLICPSNYSPRRRRPAFPSPTFADVRTQLENCANRSRVGRLCTGELAATVRATTRASQLLHRGRDGCKALRYQIVRRPGAESSRGSVRKTHKPSHP